MNVVSMSNDKLIDNTLFNANEERHHSIAARRTIARARLSECMDELQRRLKERDEWRKAADRIAEDFSLGLGIPDPPFLLRLVLGMHTDLCLANQKIDRLEGRRPPLPPSLKQSHEGDEKNRDQGLKQPPKDPLDVKEIDRVTVMDLMREGKDLARKVRKQMEPMFRLSWENMRRRLW